MGEKYSNKQIIEALTITKGLIYAAAVKVGCTPQTIYNRAKRYQIIQDTIETGRGQVLDVAEAKLFEAIHNGEAWAIAFTLKTLGKNRGYVERTQQQAVTQNDIDAEIENELARVAAGREGADAGQSEGEAVGEGDAAHVDTSSIADTAAG
jgi:hypothetical protein